jgi:hypothetical protein
LHVSFAGMSFATGWGQQHGRNQAFQDDSGAVWWTGGNILRYWRTSMADGALGEKGFGQKRSKTLSERSEKCSDAGVLLRGAD